MNKCRADGFFYIPDAWMLRGSQHWKGHKVWVRANRSPGFFRGDENVNKHI